MGRTHLGRSRVLALAEETAKTTSHLREQAEGSERVSFDRWSSRNLLLASPGITPPTVRGKGGSAGVTSRRSEEHTSELQSLTNLVCRLLLEKKKKKKKLR